MLRFFVLLKTTKAAQKVIGTHSMTIRYEEEAKRSFGERMHVYVLYNKNGFNAFMVLLSFYVHVNLPELQ